MFFASLVLKKYELRKKEKKKMLQKLKTVSKITKSWGNMHNPRGKSKQSIKKKGKTFLKYSIWKLKFLGFSLSKMKLKSRILKNKIIGNYLPWWIKLSTFSSVETLDCQFDFCTHTLYIYKFMRPLINTILLIQCVHWVGVSQQYYVIIDHYWN